MKLFGQVVRTLVNVSLIPVAVAKDVVTLGGVLTEETPAIKTLIQQIKDDASEDE